MSYPYMLERMRNTSCRAAPSAGCVDSSILTVSGTLNEAIGYIKASNTDEFDHFGISLSLSADGNTLAVGAYHEDSNATGVNGEQSDNFPEYCRRCLCVCPKR